ncbi:hypothetical protein CMI41_03345 [Candidatus Pacearchaeota archaeon]|nr:hypothetical protein [Candidatus Pacearchaeota archaeon]|tara:strand:+ start:4566 stop:5195 length:630 start_codon:yes stop_codon:yes gene_type:complete
MILSLSCSPTQRQAPYQSQRQALTLPYETVGDLELFSLHRIKNRIGTLGVHETTRNTLVTNLLKENQKYRELTTSKKYCVTFQGVDSAFDRTVDFLRKQSAMGLKTIKDQEVREELSSRITEALAEQGVKIRSWFDSNYDGLIYDQSSKIPFPVIRQMRKSFSAWASGNIGITLGAIGDLIAAAAKEEGIDPKRYGSDEELWEDLKDCR